MFTYYFFGFEDYYVAGKKVFSNGKYALKSLVGKSVD